MLNTAQIIRATYIAKEIRASLEKKDFKIQDIADKLGVSHSYISQNLSGKKIPTDMFFENVGKAIGLTDTEINKIFKEADIEEFMYKYGEEIGNIDKDLTILEALEFIESKAKLSTAEKIVLDEIKNKNK